MFEPSTLIPKLLEPILAKLSTSAMNLGVGAGKGVLDALRINFSEYLHSATRRAEQIKTLLHRDEPISLFSIYVTTYLESGSRQIRDTTVIDRARKSHSFFVVGSAGSGKSIFMKYLFLQLVEGNAGKIPVMLELRNLNSPDYDGNFLTFVHNTMIRRGSVLTKEQLSTCLRENLMIMILDGLDEIEYNRRSSVEQQIVRLHEEFPELGIVIASRPDERLSSWSEFRVYRVRPMNKRQLKTLINRLPYDQDSRSAFVKEIEHGLYEKHESFLSNPLLATMMLMTFDQFAHIPDKIHIFYEQAFETLFFRHDASKQTAFRRQMYTDIAINDFKNCLSAVCISSYAKEKYLFTQSEILDYIRTAVKFAKLEIDDQRFLQDLLESVCILQRDGLFVSFSHRSFQEYFAANFLARSPSIEIAPLLDRFASRLSDNVIGMAFDMNRPLIERDWVLPRMRDLVKEIRDLDPCAHPIEFAKIIYGTLEITPMPEEPVVLIKNLSDRAPFVFSINHLYREYFAIWDDNEEGRVEELRILYSELSRRGISSHKSGWRIEPARQDNIWFKQLRFGKSLLTVHKELIGLSNIIEKSVAEQRDLTGELFS